MPISKPSEVELQVLKVLWRDGPCSVRDVQARMSDGKSRAYTTVLTTMQVMEKKGMLSHTRRGLAYIYSPAVSERKVTGNILRDLLRNVFSSPTAVMQNLLSEGNISDEEAREIQTMIESHIEQGKPKGGKAKP
jgi:BlaI family transcriptional regulator, penicillinase repressor